MTDSFASALDGVRVLDLTEDRGLYAGKLLAEFGADVIKIEKPQGSKARRVGPFKGDIPGPENSLYFANFNTNKRGITLNLDNPAGQDIFKQLANRTDVAIEDFEVGAMHALGLDYPVLRELNPRLVMASVTGFGQTGPYSHYQAPDIVSFAMGGLMYTSGEPERPPVVAPCDQAFHAVSILTAFGILAALYLRLTTGEGQLVDASAHEVMSHQNHEAIMRYSVGSELGARTGSQFLSAPARIYPCKDGYVHILAIRINHWQRLLELLGNPEMLTGSAWDDSGFRRRNTDLIDPIVTEFTMSRTKAELTELCQAKGVPCTPVNTAADFSGDRHVKERGFIREIEHPVIGRYSFLGPPYRLSQTPCRVERPAPLLGQHNREVYGGELGYSDDEMTRLKTDGII
ncbi:MAG: CoA transferase [Chloroflexi bacterium]|nr:CoA transferase [Chloroflexota bacterium]